MSDRSSIEKELSEAQARVKSRFQSMARRHLPPVRKTQALDPQIQSHPQPPAQKQIEESSSARGPQKETESTPPPDPSTQQIVVSQSPPTSASDLPQPIPLAVAPPPEVIHIEEDAPEMEADKPRKHSRGSLVTIGEKRKREEAAQAAREEAAQADRQEKFKSPAPPSSAAPRQAPSRPVAPSPTPFKSATDYSAFPPGSYTQEEIEQARREVREPGFREAYRQSIRKKNLMDVCLEMEIADLLQVLRTREERAETIRLREEHSKKVEEVNDAISARMQQATAYYSELERRLNFADEQRTQAETDLALEREASSRHLSNIASLAEQLSTVNAELSSRTTELLSAQSDLRQMKEEQAASSLEHQRLLNLKEQLLTEKEQMAASLASSQNAVIEMKEEMSQLRGTISELKAKEAEQSLIIAELKCSHLQYLRNWANSPAYTEAVAYSAQTNYCVGYSDARVAIFEVLRKLGLSGMLSPGEFRAYDDERMLATGRTLRLPVTKRLAINPPGTPANDLEKTEWEPPYPSPLPVEGELTDLSTDLYADLVADYERRGYSSKRKTPVAEGSEVVPKRTEESSSSADRDNDSGAQIDGENYPGAQFLS